MMLNYPVLGHWCVTVLVTENSKDLNVPCFNYGFKDAVQSVCKQRLCLHFRIQNIEFYFHDSRV